MIYLFLKVDNTEPVIEMVQTSDPQTTSQYVFGMRYTDLPLHLTVAQLTPLIEQVTAHYRESRAYLTSHVDGAMNDEDASDLLWATANTIINTNKLNHLNRRM